jgi:hypothetical protein
VTTSVTAGKALPQQLLCPFDHVGTTNPPATRDDGGEAQRKIAVVVVAFGDGFGLKRDLAPTRSLQQRHQQQKQFQSSEIDILRGDETRLSSRHQHPGSAGHGGPVPALWEPPRFCSGAVLDVLLPPYDDGCGLLLL